MLHLLIKAHVYQRSEPTESNLSSNTENYSDKESVSRTLSNDIAVNMRTRTSVLLKGAL